MMLSPHANKVLAKIQFWREISRQRKQLSKMSDYLLKDIGISRTEADREAKRPFWDHAPVEDVSLRRRTGTVSKVTPKKTNTEFKLKFNRSPQ